MNKFLVAGSVRKRVRVQASGDEYLDRCEHVKRRLLALLDDIGPEPAPPSAPPSVLRYSREKPRQNLQKKRILQVRSLNLANSTLQIASSSAGPHRGTTSTAGWPPGRRRARGTSTRRPGNSVRRRRRTPGRPARARTSGRASWRI